MWGRPPMNFFDDDFTISPQHGPPQFKNLNGFETGGMNRNAMLQHRSNSLGGYPIQEQQRMFNNYPATAQSMNPDYNNSFSTYPSNGPRDLMMQQLQPGYNMSYGHSPWEQEASMAGPYHQSTRNHMIMNTGRGTQPYSLDHHSRRHRLNPLADIESQLPPDPRYQSLPPAPMPLSTFPINDEKIPDLTVGSSSRTEKHANSTREVMAGRPVGLWTDFSNASEQEKLILTVDVKSVCATVKWSSPNFTGNYEYEVRVTGQKSETKKFSHDRTQIKMKTVPGMWYEVDIRALTKHSRRLLADGTTKFKAVLSKSELNDLHLNAIEFLYRKAEPYLHPFDMFYRDKPNDYWTKTRTQDGGLMRKYLKDKNGQPGTPINDHIKGLFFNARMINMKMSRSSIYGNERFIVPAPVLLHNKCHLYFADFYCNYSEHYVTLVVTIDGSQTDQFCRKHLLPLNLETNMWMRMIVSQDMIRGPVVEYWINNRVWTEVFMTEDIPLTVGVFDYVEGRGKSTPGGLPNNKYCQICNLHPDKPPPEQEEQTNADEKRSEHAGSKAEISESVGPSWVAGDDKDNPKNALHSYVGYYSILKNAGVDDRIAMQVPYVMCDVLNRLIEQLEPAVETETTTVEPVVETETTTVAKKTDVAVVLNTSEEEKDHSPAIPIDCTALQDIVIPEPPIFVLQKPDPSPPTPVCKSVEPEVVFPVEFAYEDSLVAKSTSVLCGNILSRTITSSKTLNVQNALEVARCLCATVDLVVQDKVKVRKDEKLPSFIPLSELAGLPDPIRNSLGAVVIPRSGFFAPGHSKDFKPPPPVVVDLTSSTASSKQNDDASEAKNTKKVPPFSSEGTLKRLISNEPKKSIKFAKLVAREAKGI